MKRYLLFFCLLVVAFKADKPFEGWRQIEKTKIGGEKIVVYFFDFMSKLEKLRPDYLQYKGREFTNILDSIYFQFPTYVAKRDITNEDSIIYFILRPNKNKVDDPSFYDFEVLKVSKDFSLQLLEDKTAYKDKILKTLDAKGCRGGLVNEYNEFIQKNPNKDKLIGNGIQIADSIFTRVIPYKEVKTCFYRLIESNL